MNWNNKAHTLLSIKSSPSYGFNNLSCSGSFIAYFRENIIYMVNEDCVTGTDVVATKLPYKDNYAITQVRWCRIDSKRYLIATNVNGFVVVDGSGTSVLYNYDISNMSDIGGPGSYCKGISQTPNGLLLIGTSKGKILLFTGGKDWKLKDTISGHDHPIVYIDFSSKNVVSCDNHGRVIVWDNNMKEVCKFESNDSCTSCFIKGDSVVVSYTSGHIRIFKINEGLRCEISGHSRCITGMCLHPTEDYFATCGEDSVVNVYTLPHLESKDCTNV